jgi:glucose/mannose-6-phosphate isomerase
MDLVSGVKEELEEGVQVIRRLAEEFSSTVPSRDNKAKSTALALIGTFPLVFGSHDYSSVVYRYKTQFNENSKSLSFCGNFSELNHNEVMGWELTEPVHKLTSILLLRDRNEPLYMKERIETTKKIFADKASKVIELYASGNSKTVKMMSLIFIGDLISVYLAIARGIDPTPVGTIERMKTELKGKYDLLSELETELEEVEGSKL